MNKPFNKLKIVFVALAIAIALTSCGGGDDESKPLPVANFEFEVNETSPLQVSFTDASENGESYAWNFGDGAGISTVKNPSYTYAEAGTYSVTLVVTNPTGSDEVTKEVTVTSSDLIANGDFDDDSEWTIISHNTSGNGLLTIADGVATWNEVTDVPSGSWGQEAHIGIYQAIEVESGEYQVDLDIEINGFDEVWFEVWIGTTQPTEGADYGAPAVLVLSANAWDCKDAQGNYSGSLAENSCNDTDGGITLSEGTYYVVIRSGGFTFGEGGIVADNVSMIKVD
jgi:PKD repeat protein